MLDLFDLLYDTLELNDELINALSRTEKTDKKPPKPASKWIDEIRRAPDGVTFKVNGKPATREDAIRAVEALEFSRRIQKHMDELDEKYKSSCKEEPLPFTDPPEFPYLDDEDEDDDNWYTDDDEVCDEDPPMYGIPDIDKIFVNPPYTTIKWMDGTVTTVKCSSDQEWDRYSGFCAAVVKKLFGSSNDAKKLLDYADENAYKERLAAERAKRRAEKEEAEKSKRAARANRDYKRFEEDVQQRTYDKIVDEAAARRYQTIHDLSKSMNAKAEAHFNEISDNIKDAFESEPEVHED